MVTDGQSMIIRKATQEDIEKAIILGRVYYLEASEKAMHFDENKGRELIKKLLEGGLGIVAEEDGQIIGMMGAEIFSYWFSDSLMAHDVMIYIAPDQRGRGIGSSLIRVYIEWALSQGVERENIFIGIDSGIDTEKTEKKYNSLGFVRSGISMRLGGKI